MKKTLNGTCGYAHHNLGPSVNRPLDNKVWTNLECAFKKGLLREMRKQPTL
jgi:hypothetical protein